MGLVVCPECKNDVSQYAESCPTCGFPVKSFMEEHKLTDIKKVWVCPKCAYYDDGVVAEYMPPYIKCKYCNTTVIEVSDEDGKKLKSYKGAEHVEEKYQFSIHLAKKYSNQFDMDAYKEHRRILAENISRYKAQSARTSYTNIQPSNQPKCPTCSSTKIKKISGTKKIMGAIGFGLLSKSAKSQFECLDCGYEW